MRGLVGKQIRTILVVSTSLLVLAVFLLPYLNIALTSFKPAQEVFRVPPTFLPSAVSLRSYSRMLEYLPFFQYLRNSLLIAFASTALSLIVGCAGAYGFSRYAFPLSKIFFMMTLCTKMFPFIVIGIPIYLFMRRLGLIDTHVALVLTYSAINLPFVIWLMTGFFEGVPWELEEAAKIDGCGRLATFARIVLPLSAPGLATTAIFCFMLAWNEFLFALLLTASNAKTMPVGICEFITVWSIEWGPMSATAVSYTIPILAFSLFVQKHIVAGMTLGAVKG